MSAIRVIESSGSLGSLQIAGGNGDFISGSIVAGSNITINDTSLAPALGGTIFHSDAWNTQSTYNWTVPAGVTEISVVCIGGGGSGVSQHDGASGGGGGLAYKNNITVVAGQTVTVYVGGGGFATFRPPDTMYSIIHYIIHYVIV